MRLHPLILLLLLPVSAPASDLPWIWEWSQQPAWLFLPHRAREVWSAPPPLPPQQAQLPPSPRQATPSQQIKSAPPAPTSNPIQSFQQPPTSTLPLTSNLSYSHNAPAAMDAAVNAPPSRWSFDLPWLGILDISSGVFLTSPGFMQPILIHHPLPRPITNAEPEYFIQDHAIRPWLEPGSGQFYITFQTAP
jgi:hypothetical protein